MRADVWRAWLGKESASSASYASLFPGLTARILEGIEFGVRVDFEGDREAGLYGPNLPIEPKDEPKVDAVIDADVRALKKAGPFDEAPFPNMAVSPIGVVPKKNSTKVRVIHHLSYPRRGDSVNAGVLDEPLELSSFGHAARAVRGIGRGCFLVKLDVEAAYKQVPVRPQDWHLLGFKWRGKWYYERVLPFGLKSSCRLWEMYATALHHLIQHLLPVEGQRCVIHYVDDFLFVVQYEQSAAALRDGALRLCAELGVPMAADKTEGPTTCLTFLGIELDTAAMEARLSAQRLLELQQLTELWARKETASVKELQSLAGLLNFACKVVRPGRFFLRRIINQIVRLGQTARSRTAQFPLTRAVRLDVEWWRAFLPQWNGKSLLYARDWQTSEQIELFTDACLEGYGAVHRDEWFAGAWRPEQLRAAFRKQRHSVPFLELHTLVQAAATWGPQWATKKIVFRCDCQPIVNAIRRCSSRVPGLMHLLRTLISLACQHGFDFRCEHVAGVTNVAADVLSRYGDCEQFRAARPNARAQQTEPTAIALPEAEDLE